MPTPPDYLERVYAGVLGKIIGVYLGRPFEGMWYRDILKEFGRIEYYVHEKRGVPLIVADDDISGTFTFVRALEDYADAGKDLTAAQIGNSWLNYIIDNRTILWWGGMGMSTEHTAFNRLKKGIQAPESGSIALNSKVVAEQIGAQIFIDAWAMVSPGQPDLAADFARKAGSVSHDGEAIYAAQVLAAMEAQAFVEPDLDKLLDIGTSFIPKDSVIYRMIAELREFRLREPDWEKAMTDVMERSYGYDKFGGNCHVVPNHGLIILALLFGDDDFQKTLMIANTCGWDTDCNSGNVGCLMGIKNGLAGIDSGSDWRGPVADRLLLPTADGGSCIADAATQAYKIANLSRRFANEEPLSPKQGAKFHFTLPGSVQGFASDEASVDSKGVSAVSTRDGSLIIEVVHLAPGRVGRVLTPTFVLPDMLKQGGYGLQACPTLSSGHKVTATAAAPKTNPTALTLRPVIRYYGVKDEPTLCLGPETVFEPGATETVQWTVPDTGGHPIYEVGFEISGGSGANGQILLDSVTWSGQPKLTLGSPTPSGEMWMKQWVDGVSQFQRWGRSDEKTQAFVAIQNEGRGLAIHGTRDWVDYTVAATVTPHLATSCGIAARVQGMRRYYALLLAQPNLVRLVKVLDDETVLGEAPFTWTQNDDPHHLELTVRGTHIIGSVDGRDLFNFSDEVSPLSCGAIGIVIEEGRVACSPVQVEPA